MNDTLWSPKPLQTCWLKKNHLNGNRTPAAHMVDKYAINWTTAEKIRLLSDDTLPSTPHEIPQFKWAPAYRRLNFLHQVNGTLISWWNSTGKDVWKLYESGWWYKQGHSEVSLDNSVWLLHFVVQQRKNGYMEQIILNIQNCLQISGGC
jgi:hypothetical protein